MSNPVIQFDFNSQQIRTISIENSPWFVAKDVCDILEIVNVSQACANLDADEKLLYTLHTSGQNRETTFINESGLYALILRSNKPQAKVFRKWVTSEVLPAIRKTGGYSSQEKTGYVELLEEHNVLQRKHIALQNTYIALLEEKTAPKPKRPAPKRFTPDALSEIAKLNQEGVHPKQIAEQLGFGFSSISLVLRGMSYVH